jgi:glutaredoxin
MQNITLFTLPTCPKCRVIKMKLTSAGVDFEECQDVVKMQNLGIETTPALLVGPDRSKGSHLIKNFAEINEFVTVMLNGQLERRHYA